MKQLFIVVAVLIGMTSPAFAKHCPKDAKIIDQSMREAFELTTRQMAEVKALLTIRTEITERRSKLCTRPQKYLGSSHTSQCDGAVSVKG